MDKTMTEPRQTIKIPAQELIPTRASLLERLRLWSDEKSWQEFFNSYWKLIYGVARTTGLSPEESQDVVQETLLSVAKKLPGFEYRPSEQGGSFKQWLLQIAKWRIKDQFRKRPPIGTTLHVLDVATGIIDPLSNQIEDLWKSEWDNYLLKAALDRLKEESKPLWYQLFHLQIIKQWTASRAAASLGVSESLAFKAKGQLAKDLGTILKQLNREEDEA